MRRRIVTTLWFKSKRFTSPDIDFGEISLRKYKESSTACLEFEKLKHGGKGSLVGRNLKTCDKIKRMRQGLWTAVAGD